MQRRILIVEDSPTMRRLLRLALRTLPDTSLEEAVDGMDALRKLSSDDYDLALIDLLMPVLDGLHLIGLLREEPRTATLPIAVISTEGASEARERALLLGADAYLTKPIEPHRVRALATELLEKG